MSLVMLLSVSNANGLAWTINSITVSIVFLPQKRHCLAGSLAQQIFIRLGAAQYAASRKYRIQADGQWSCCDFTHNIHHNAGSTFSLIPSDDLFKIQSKFWNRPLLKLSKFKAFGGWLSLSLELPRPLGPHAWDHIKELKRAETYLTNYMVGISGYLGFVKYSQNQQWFIHNGGF